MNKIIEQAKELNRRLTLLLDDPQPGLLSWCIVLHETLVALGKLSGTNKVSGIDSVNIKKD